MNYYQIALRFQLSTQQTRCAFFPCCCQIRASEPPSEREKNTNKQQEDENDVYGAGTKKQHN